MSTGSRLQKTPEGKRHNDFRDSPFAACSDPIASRGPAGTMAAAVGSLFRRRVLAPLAALVTACSIPAALAATGAPRDGDVFTNPGGPRPWPGPQVTVPFFVRKAWTSIVGREGAAPLVRFDRDAMLENPSMTWIGHSTMLVRMDGVSFLTDPIFSDRASPFSFAGPKRLVPPGVPLSDLPPVDFVTLSHDHYDHTDLASIEALAKRGGGESGAPPRAGLGACGGRVPALVTV